MRDIEAALRRELTDKEYAEGYAESFLSAYLATQIRVLREQRGFKTEELAQVSGFSPSTVRRLEDVNNQSWNIKTLVSLARIFDLRLRVSFETFGSLAVQASRFTRTNLERTSREHDPGLRNTSAIQEDQPSALLEHSQVFGQDTESSDIYAEATTSQSTWGQNTLNSPDLSAQGAMIR